MDKSNGLHIIQQYRRQWLWQLVISSLLCCIAIVLVLYSVAGKFYTVGVLTGMVISLVVIGLVLLLRKPWRLSDTDVARYLNRQLPQMEESAELLLRPSASLNALEQLQAQKAEQRLAAASLATPANRRLKRDGILLFIAGILAFIIYLVPWQPAQSSGILAGSNTNPVLPPEKVLPQVKTIVVRINPPAYTAKPARVQDRFNVMAEENATVTWNLETNTAVQQVQLRFNDKEIVQLRAANAGGRQWTTQRTVQQPGFYQVKIGSQWSELYKIEVIKDKPPVVQVRQPKQQTLIELGQPKQVLAEVVLSDDYGVSNAYMVATVASGSGESVKFKEQQLGFNGFAKGRQQQQLKQNISLGSLGMQPGDELYLYVTATDNHAQQTRSDVFIITLEDTTQLMSMDGLANALNIKPEFFRSQRQIIIETEQLLKDRSTITVEQFNKKSNELGIDQRLLRLRYGKFLGEENNTSIGEEHEGEEDDHDHEEDQAATFGDMDAIMDQYAHKHDIAEDATFFDPETKKQLKATLAQMWNAEGRLRLYKPAEALPFAYKALKLLKDLQQKSRVYVAKTSSKIAPLKPAEKRLTGDLTKIGSPLVKEERKPANDAAIVLRKTLGVLEQLKYDPVISNERQGLLQQGTMQVAKSAAANPAAYLDALQALKRVERGSLNKSDIAMAQKGLQQLLNSPTIAPYKPEVPPQSGLSNQYFNTLKKQAQ